MNAFLRDDPVDEHTLDDLRASGRSLSDGLHRLVSAHIRSGQLPSGTKLPSVRGLARRYRVSPDTVVRVYQRLVHDGSIEAIRGSGFYVSNRRAIDPPRALRGPPAAPIIDKKDWELLLRLDRPLDQLPSSSFIQSVPLPGDIARSALRSALRTRPDLISAYGEPSGYLPLRRQIQRKLASEGIGCDTEAILTGTGATGVMNVVVRALVRAGTYGLVEDPGPFMHTMLLLSQGAEIAKVPREADGPDIATLRNLCELHRPKIFFCSSTQHNPTGGTISPHKAYQMLLLAQEFDMLIVDDTSYADLRPATAGHMWTPLATLDGLRHVIHVGSFSRVLSPLLGVGYLAAGPDAMTWLKPFRAVHSLGLNLLAERAVYQLLEDGHFHRRSRALSGHVAASRKTLIANLARTPFTFADKGSGLYIWLSLGADVTAEEVVQKMMREGIVLAHPELFSTATNHASFTRLNVTTTTERTLELMSDMTGR